MLENDRTYIASPVLDDVERVGDDVQWAGSLIILDQNLKVDPISWTVLEQC